MVKKNVFLRLIPYLLSRYNPYFSYESSHFRIERSKQSTARIVSFKEFKILSSYTLEASFFGCDKLAEIKKDHHLDELELESIGRDLCKQLTVFLSQKEINLKLQDLSEFLKLPNPQGKIFHNPSRKIINKEGKSEGKLKKIMIKVSLSRETASPLIEKSDFPEENDENSNFTIQKVINELQDENLAEIYFPDEDSDSGGSDSQASINDEKKIKYLLQKQKSSKRKTTQETPIKAVHTSQNLNFSQVRRSCLTPEIIIAKNRPKSRISLRKKSEILYKNIIPSRIMLRSPFLEENTETFRENPTAANNSAVTRSYGIRDNKIIKQYQRLEDYFLNISLENSRFLFDKTYKKLKK